MNDNHEWKDDYAIGDAEVDAQHRNLFAIANRMREDMPPGRLEEELMNLYRHTREHPATLQTSGCSDSSE